MSTSSAKVNSKPDNKNKNSNIIKYGLVSQEKSNIKVYELLSSFFISIKPNNYSIKDEFHFEFSPLSNPTLTITINHLKTVEKICEHYKNFNFFFIFIDVQSSNCIDYLEKAIDVIIDAGENSYNKKCYIFGFYIDDNKKTIPEEKITTIIDAKGIEYYYSQLKNNEYEKLSKILDRIIGDSNAIMVEKFLDQKHSELVLDNSNSHCYIF